MKTLIVALAFQGLLALVSSSVIRDDPIPAISPEVTIPFGIFTGQSSSAQNITLAQESPQQVDLCNCGRSTATKIVGGTKASEGEFPWRVQIRMTTLGLCGGTIISPRWILTAAHCLIEGDKIDVRVGSTSLKKGKSYEIKRFLRHEHYEQPHRHANDIALIELKQDLDFSDPKIGPACLPYQLAGQTERTAKVVASGWGETEKAVGSVYLLKVTLDVIGNKQCQEIHTGSQHYLPTGKEIIGPTQMCTQGVHKDTCKGDSGGSIDESIDGKSYAVGVVSYGHGCARDNEAGVYTRVSEYTSWIEENTGIRNFCKA